MANRRKTSTGKSVVIHEKIIENGYDKMAIMQRVCEELIEGRSLRSICHDEGMPNKSTILRWLNEDDGTLATSIAHARELQADAHVDDIVEIVNDLTSRRPDRIDANEARVAIWAKQWVAAKMRPKKYGEKVEHEHTGKVDVTDLSQIATPEEAEAAHRKLLDRIRR